MEALQKGNWEKYVLVEGSQGKGGLRKREHEERCIKTWDKGWAIGRKGIGEVSISGRGTEESSICGRNTESCIGVWVSILLSVTHN